MLLSSEGETRDGFHYSILKADKSKAHKQIFLKGHKTLLLVLQGVGSCVFCCVGTFPPFITKVTAKHSSSGTQLLQCSNNLASPQSTSLIT